MQTTQPPPARSDAGAPPRPGDTFTEELVIREARRRQRRRWIGWGCTALVLVGAALLITRSTGHTPSKAKPSIHHTGVLPPPAAATVAACASSSLSVGVGFVQGTSEEWIIPLEFTNQAAAPCTVTGYPQVSLVNGTGQQVGLPIEQVQGGWPGGSVTLAHGQTAEAVLSEPDTTDLLDAGESCTPVALSAIRVASPAVVVAGSSGEWSQATTTCSTGSVTPSIGPLHTVLPPGDG